MKEKLLFFKKFVLIILSLLSNEKMTEQTIKLISSEYRYIRDIVLPDYIQMYLYSEINKIQTDKKGKIQNLEFYLNPLDKGVTVAIIYESVPEEILHINMTDMPIFINAIKDHAPTIYDFIWLNWDNPVYEVSDDFEKEYKTETER